MFLGSNKTVYLFSLLRQDRSRIAGYAGMKFINLVKCLFGRILRGSQLGMVILY